MAARGAARGVRRADRPGRRRRAGAGRDAARGERSTPWLGIDAAAVAGGERISYTKSAAEAVGARGRRARTAPMPRSCSSPRRSRRSWPSRATATSCPRSRPTSIPRPSPGSCSTRTSGRPTSRRPMTDLNSSDRLVPRTATERPPRPQGRDRARRARPVRRVLAPRAPLAPQADPVRPRRARRLLGLGALPAPLRRPRLGGPRPQPAQPLLVADRGPGHARHRVLHGGRRRRRWSGSGPSVGRRGPRDGRPARAQGHRAGAGRPPTC